MKSKVISGFSMRSRAAVGATGTAKWPGAPAKFDLIGSFDAVDWITVMQVDVKDTTGSYFSGKDIKIPC